MKKVAICKFEDLIGKEDAISVKTMLKIEKLKKEKYLLLVHSKMSIEDLLYYNKDFPFIDYIINEKGYYIYDVKKNKKIINNRINKKIINKFYKLLDKYNIKFIGENGIIKEGIIKDEDVYEINIINNSIELDNLSLNIRKDNKKIIITNIELSYDNLLKELYLKLKINEKNIIYLTKKKINELD